MRIERPRPIKRFCEVVSERRLRGTLTCLLLSAGAALGQTDAGSSSGRADEPPQEPRGAAAQKGPGEAAPPGLLAGIDTSNLNLSGADLDVEMVGEQLILRGNEDDLDLLEALIAVLEETTEQKDLRVVSVTEKDGREIATSVQEAVREVFYEPNQRPEHEVTVTALSSTVLLVSALPDQIDWVVDLIKKLDEVAEDLPDLKQLVFPIIHRKASDVAEQLKEIIGKMREKQGATGAQTELQIIANNANNSIMVLAEEKERDKIQRLLNELDVEPVAGWGEVKLTLFPLLHSKADELAKVINDLLKSQEAAKDVEEVIYRLSISKATPDGEFIELPPIDLQKPMRILPDAGTNSLIVATVEENVGPMGELIRLMDGLALAEDVSVRLFPLRFADAQSVGEMLTKMFDQGKKLTEDPDGSGQNAVPEGSYGKALVYNVNVTTDVRTNTVIVAGRPEQLSLTEMVVAELDRPTSALKFPVQLLALKHTDVAQVAKILTDLFEQRFEAAQASDASRVALERERVFLTVDLRSNSLIISASEENYLEALTISTQLDTRPPKPFDQIRIVRCARLSAQDMKEKIEELWKRKGDLRREGELLEDLPIVVADSRSNALVIASNLEDYEEIQRLVRTLESQPMMDDSAVFHVKYADATVLAGMLEELLKGIEGASEGFKAPTVLPDKRGNSLIVAGTQDALDRVESLVARLDVEGGTATAAFEVYPLAHASAGALAKRMQEMFDQRQEGEEVKRTPIIILAEESSNSLLCSASRDNQGEIAELVELLDRPSSIARQFEIFPLKLARAAAIAEKLESIFASQGDAGGGRTDAIATQADERTNSIIVWASPSQMQNIADIIARLDTSAPVVEMMVKVIQLKQALAEDFATLLTETVIGEGAGGDDEKAVIMSFPERQPDGSTAVRKLLRQDIRVQPDPRTNSLMVMAPTDSMAMLEAMIRDFDRIKPIRSELRLFPLINSDSQSMVDQLTELFSKEGAEGETRSQLVFGGGLDDLEFASVGQELRFTADPRTNTLIAAGAEVDLRMVEEYVRYLDSQEAEDRVVSVYHTKYLDGDEIASAISGFNQQEQDVLGAIDDEEAQARRIERQISVESVGKEEQGSSSVIVGTSRQVYDRTMHMIEQLDRPEPQVMISVIIAAVTLTDGLELGIEIAGQDLLFSEKATLGSNGTIQGADFDFVAGTDLGAAGLGLGGFNFTITGEDFSFLLHALQQNSRAEVLSRPVLMVRNGEEGKITVADQVPIVESSRLSDTGQTQSTIGREDVGIVLTATPQISPDGYVTIAVKQEISNISGENVQLTEGVSSPIFQTREVDTNVTVRDGETVVIGGLIQVRTSEGENKVPILGDLPLIGALFRTTSVNKNRTELLVAMTVDVMRTDEDVHATSVKKRDDHEELDFTNPLFERLRILPEGNALGPADGPPSPAPRAPSAPPTDTAGPDVYGPTPKTYGPKVVPAPGSATASASTYGPRLAKHGSENTE